MKQYSLAAVAAFTILATGADAALSADMIPPDVKNLGTTGSRTEFDSAQSPEALDAFYRKALLMDGWSMTPDVQNGEVISFYFSRGAEGQGAAVFKPKGNYTHVTLTLTQ